MLSLIAYATCIAHGFDLTYTVDHMCSAVHSGYWPLYRFDPNLLDENGWIPTGSPVTTRHPGLFLAGDYSIGASTLIQAIGHAKECARASMAASD